MASPAGNESHSSTKWQDDLLAACRNQQLPAPSWQTFSDRRGGRTAWTCTVTVSGQQISARMWYDGQYINNAKEDAAEVALQKLFPNSAGGQSTPPSNNNNQGW